MRHKKRLIIVFVSVQALVDTLRPQHEAIRLRCDRPGGVACHAARGEEDGFDFGAPLARAGAVSAGMRFQRAAEAHADWAS